MKTCDKCGIEITNGKNGCMLLGNICFDCNGGLPIYHNVPARFVDDNDYESLINYDRGE